MSLLKWTSVFFDLVTFIPIRWKCLMLANFLGVDFLRTALKLRQREKISSSLVYFLHKTHGSNDPWKVLEFSQKTLNIFESSLNENSLHLKKKNALRKDLKALQYVKVFSHESVFSSNFGVSSIIHLPLKKVFRAKERFESTGICKVFWSWKYVFI